MTDESRAFVPGHVTGFFSVHRHDDPPRAGSRGAGVTLGDGVTTTVAPADERRVTLNGERASVEAVERVLAALDVTAAVDCETPLPVGAGFGVSGAAALGTAVAASAALDLARTENDLVGVAHAAEVAAGSGLGDVVAQARGGVPIRLEPGAPPHGRLDGVPAAGRVEYVSMGELSTADVIGGEVEALSAAGERALADLRDRPTTDHLIELSRRFAREADLATDDVAAVLDDVPGTAMAMLGRSAFAFGTALSDAGYDASATAVHPGGATLC